MEFKFRTRSKKMMVILGFALLSGSVFGIISAVANDPYNTTEPLYIESADYKKNMPKLQYDKNAYGLTYGSASLAATPVEEPDLIAALGVDGTEGYVYKKDLDGETPKTVQEALEQQAALKNSGARQIPLYKKDGKTVIGVFEISGFIVEDLKNTLKNGDN